MMKRRDLLASCVLTLGAGMRALAQDRRKARIAVLSSLSFRDDASRLKLMKQALLDHQLIEGRDYDVVYRGVEGDRAQLLPEAKALVAMEPTIIVTLGGPWSAQAAKAATSIIPIVFAGANNPVGNGLITGPITRPGGNVTGVATDFYSIVPKQVDLLFELKPGLRKLCVLMSKISVGSNARKAAENGIAAAVAQRRLDIASLDLDANDYATGFGDRISASGCDAVIVLADADLYTNARSLVDSVAASGRACMYWRSEFVRLGGFASYGPRTADGYRTAGKYVARILGGEPPGILPIVGPDRFELAINLKAARALGQAVPERILAVADEVIE